MKYCVVYLIVKSGESLWSIARKYKVSVSDIKKENKLTSDLIHEKQKLKIIKNNHLE